MTATKDRRGLLQTGLAPLFQQFLSCLGLAKGLAAAQAVARLPVGLDDSDIQVALEARMMRDILIEEPGDKHLNESSTISEYKPMAQMRAPTNAVGLPSWGEAAESALGRRPRPQDSRQPLHRNG